MLWGINEERSCLHAKLWVPIVISVGMLCFAHKSLKRALSSHLLMMLFIWLSFSSCCLRSRSSLSSSLTLYSISSFCICCSCTRRRLSYSSNRRLDTFRRSFNFAISCSYCMEGKDIGTKERECQIFFAKYTLFSLNNTKMKEVAGRIVTTDRSVVDRSYTVKYLHTALHHYCSSTPGYPNHSASAFQFWVP